MNTLREAAQQALEALEQSETFVPYEGFGMARREAERKHQAAITALEAALAEPQTWVCPDSAEHRYQKPGHCEDCGKTLVQKPVAYSVGRTLHWHEGKGVNDAQLYLAPPQRKPLTEEEIKEMFHAELRALPSYPSAIEELPDRLARAIERAHGIT